MATSSLLRAVFAFLLSFPFITYGLHAPRANPHPVGNVPRFNIGPIDIPINSILPGLPFNKPSASPAYPTKKPEHTTKSPTKYPTYPPVPYPTRSVDPSTKPTSAPTITPIPTSSVGPSCTSSGTPVTTGTYTFPDFARVTPAAAGSNFYPANTWPIDYSTAFDDIGFSTDEDTQMAQNRCNDFCIAQPLCASWFSYIISTGLSAPQQQCFASRSLLAPEQLEPRGIGSSATRGAAFDRICNPPSSPPPGRRWYTGQQ